MVLELGLAAGPTSARGIPWWDESDQVIATVLELLHEQAEASEGN